jgi:hypothetical protein
MRLTEQGLILESLTKAGIAAEVVRHDRAHRGPEHAWWLIDVITDTSYSTNQFLTRPLQASVSQGIINGLMMVSKGKVAIDSDDFVTPEIAQRCLEEL